MRILLVANKFLNRGILRRIDASYWNFYIPIRDLGHEVYFYDIEKGADKPFLQVIEEFSPDLIFSILTFGNGFKHEPLKEIEQITSQGKIKTFNWFYDDTWRYESVSKKECHKFTACSTPEPAYLDKYRQNGYKNIFLGSWHTNFDIFEIHKSKFYDIAFCGLVNSQRANMVHALGSQASKVNMFYGVAQEDMMMNYSLSKIGINFSANENDVEKKTQMKLRMIEIPSTSCMLLTEYTSGLEQLFNIDEEIVCFKETEEMISKAKYLLKEDTIREKIAIAGHQRCLKDHNSHKRMQDILSKIQKI